MPLFLLSRRFQPSVRFLRPSYVTLFWFMKQLILTLALFAGGTAFSQQVSFLHFTPADDLSPMQTDVLTDGDDRVSAGLLFNSAIGKNDVWLTVYNATDVVWSKAVRYPGVFVTSTEIATLTGSTDLILCTRGSYGTHPCIVLHRIDRQTGAVVWSEKLDIEDDFTGMYVEKNGILVTVTDDILVTCTTLEYIQVARFTGNGDLLFTRKINNIGTVSGNNPGFTFRPATDGGYIATFRNDSLPTILKLNADLSVQWAKTWAIEAYAHPISVTERSNGNFIVGGFTDQYDFIAEVSPAGELLHYWRFSDNMYGIDHIYELADGRIMASGTGFYRVIDLSDGSAGRYTGYVNYVFEKMADDGVLGFTYNDLQQEDNFMVTTGFDPANPGCFLGRWLDSLNMTEIAVPASQIDTAIFFLYDSGTLSSYEPALVEYPFTLSACALELNENSMLQLSLFPNPAKSGSVLSIAGSPAVGILQLTDLSGKILATFDISKGTNTIELPELSTGMYLVRYAESNGKTNGTERLVIE